MNYAQTCLTSLYAAHDCILSLKAKGLYLAICGNLELDKWGTLDREELVMQFKDGETSYRSAWKELKGNGYIKIRRTRLDTGAYGYQYLICSFPNKRIPEYEHITEDKK